MDRFVDRILKAGFRMVLAHPERCRPLQENPERIHSILPPDVPFQLTSHSLTGEFGARPLEASLAFLSLGRPMVIATDSHSSEYRAPTLKAAVEVAALSVGREYAEQMVTELPLALLEDRPVWGPPT
jgi:protein-tyrosine phosphatase